MINQETKVGIFVLVGILIFSLAVILLEDIDLGKGYEIKVVFDNAEGLPEKGQVKIAGVEVGKVDEIDLVQNKALITVIMKPNVKVYRDAHAKIVSVGMVGNKYIELTTGSSDKQILGEGDVIIGVNSMSFDSLIETANEGLDHMVEQFKIFERGSDFDNTLTGISTNLDEITTKLNQSLGEGGENVRKTLENFNTISEDLNIISEKVKAMQINDSVLSKLIADRELAEKVVNIINSLEKVSKNLEKRFK